ncbi:hypothetical protein [Methylocystis sp.]|uniref:hypothetical protein n=1 Tax=Methylocystis sp. TaxID=1911079 RepID=UPI0025F4A2B5|nr:hypothetical protein [Methylocystis sp.]
MSSALDQSQDNERLKFDVELKKLSIEQQKLKWMAASVIVTLWAAIGTVAYGFWSTKKSAELNFQLEVAKAVRNEKGPVEAEARARYYQAIFPGRLPVDFFKQEEPFKFDSVEGDARMEYFKVIASKNYSPNELLDLWRILFPGDEWTKNDEVRESINKLDKKNNKAR